MTAPWPDLAAGARLVAGLPGYLWRRLDAAGATALVAALRAARDVALPGQRRHAFDAAGSPYGAPLRRARWEQGDVEALVRRDGVETPLTALPASLPVS